LLLVLQLKLYIFTVREVFGVLATAVAAAATAAAAA
jgi:hypothetical protein